MEIEIVRPQVHHKVSPRHLTPSAEAEPPNPLYKVASTGYTPEQKLIDVSWTTLYPFPSRECL